MWLCFVSAIYLRRKSAEDKEGPRRIDALVGLTESAHARQAQISSRVLGGPVPVMLIPDRSLAANRAISANQRQDCGLMYLVPSQQTLWLLLLGLQAGFSTLQ